MVNQLFFGTLLQHLHEELQGLLVGPPVIRQGGVDTDQYRGLARDLARRLIPFMGPEVYEATEFLCGYAPVNDALLSRLYFEIPVLNVKGNNVPGAAHFGAVVNAPIPETYVTPLVGLTYRPLPLSAFAREDVRPKVVYAGRMNWTPFLESVNADKATLKAIESPRGFAGMGNFEVKLPRSRLGWIQLAPYKARTILTLQTAPGPRARVDRPNYEVRRHYDGLRRLAAHVAAHPQTSEEIGVQIVMKTNMAMMELIYADMEGTGLAGATPPA